MTTTDSEPLTTDGVFELLSNHRRRMVLFCLRQRGGSVGMNELAEQMAAMENNVPVSDLTSQQRKRVYVSLYQTHLPKMADMNIIEYNEEEGVVRLTDQTDEIDKYLTSTDQSTYPWEFHYLGLAVSGGTVLLLSFFSVSVFGAIPILWLSIGLLILFAASAIGQYWYSQTREEPIPVELSQ